MDMEMDKGKKKEAMEPIMMEEYQIKQIMERRTMEYPTNIR